MGCSLTIVALLTPILIAVKVIVPSNPLFFVPTLEKTLFRPHQNDEADEEEDCEDYDICDNGNHLRLGQPQSTR